MTLNFTAANASILWHVALRRQQQAQQHVLENWRRETALHSLPKTPGVEYAILGTVAHACTKQRAMLAFGQWEEWIRRVEVALG